MKKFDVEKAIDYCDIYGNNSIFNAVGMALRAGLVSEETNSEQVTEKLDTIRISRKIAERWGKLRSLRNSENLDREIKKALSSDQKG